jgi:predicted site-specific integrase-resolvase
MDYWEEQAEEWRYKYRSVLQKLEETQKEKTTIEDKLSSAEYKIESELKPRIEQEHRSYDSYITDPFRGSSCDGSNCGVECGGFGKYDYCTDDWSDKEVIASFREGYDTLEEELYRRDLDLEVFKGYILFAKESVQSSRHNLKNSTKHLWSCRKDYFLELLKEIKYKFNRKRNESDHLI